jgi:putative phosphoribosyl transferase
VLRQHEEVNRWIQRYREGHPLPFLANRAVILVDDGIATGATFYASLAALRACGVRRLIAAVPVPPRVPSELRSQVDEVVILEAPALFFGIGQFYADFSQVSDEEVIECLKESRAVTAIRDLADDQRSRTHGEGYRCERCWR